MSRKARFFDEYQSRDDGQRAGFLADRAAPRLYSRYGRDEGLVQRRYASIDDARIQESERRLTAP